MRSLGCALRGGPPSNERVRGVGEEIDPSVLLDADPNFDSLDVKSAGSASMWRPHASKLELAGSASLRRRSAVEVDHGGAEERGLVADSDADHEPVDTVLLFVGFPPAALRKAKREFSAAMGQVIKLANAIQRIRLAEEALADLEKARR